jgi:D-lyxose ketol-isomerase
MESLGFQLPPFAHWSPEEWRSRGPECREIVACNLGWDITDFGLGPFEAFGLFLFTVRNGSPAEALKGLGKPYAEKIMVVREGQVTPLHYHKFKMEDIINRGGGELLIKLHNSVAGGAPDMRRDVRVSMDGVEHVIPAGGTVTLRPGESITLPTYLQHEFQGAPGKGWVMVGEVSRVNDDHTDNFFQREVGRFPQIEEDTEPFRLLMGDYARYYQP